VSREYSYAEITRTPISTTVILCVLFDTSLVPILVIASFVSFLLTTQLFLSKTQRSRTNFVEELRSLPILVRLDCPIVSSAVNIAGV